MADTAAYLIDHVIPDIPMRMWTLTIRSTQLLWLRSGYHQQLVLFTTNPERVKALKALSSTRKGD